MASKLLSIPFSTPISSAPNKSPQPLLPFPSSNLKHGALGSSVFGDPVIVLRCVASPTSVHARGKRLPASTAFSMLPTAKPERASPEKMIKWSARAIKSFGMAELEARKLKYPTTGTEALLMGTSLAAKFLRVNGITLFKVREETVKLLGKSDMYFFSPEHPRLTEPAQRALDWAVDEKLKSGDSGEVTTSHLLLGIWSEENSAGRKITASLGFDNEKAAELAKTANKDFELNYR